MRKKCNEIISLLQESFTQSEKTAPDFITRDPNYSRSRKAGNRSNADFDMMNHVYRDGAKYNYEIEYSKSLEDPSIEEAMNKIKNDENKLKKFKEFLENYFTK